MHIVPQNKDKFTINNLFYCCKVLIFTHPLVHEFLCGPKHMGTPVCIIVLQSHSFCISFRCGKCGAWSFDDTWGKCFLHTVDACCGQKLKQETESNFISGKWQLFIIFW